MERVKCCRCGHVIPQIRLEVLPNTTTCVGCSREPRKTEMDVEVDGPDPDSLRHLAKTPNGER